MLCLTRRIGQRVRLTLPDGSEIWVAVVDGAHQGYVRLGIEAPANVKIEREEIIESPNPMKE